MSVVPLYRVTSLIRTRPSSLGLSESPRKRPTLHVQRRLESVLRKHTEQAGEAARSRDSA
jgi:hypothetical protein